MASAEQNPLFGIVNRLAFCKETAAIEDPWGAGMLFHARRRTAPAHQRRQLERQVLDPIFQDAAKLARERLAAAAAAAPQPPTAEPEEKPEENDALAPQGGEVSEVNAADPAPVAAASASFLDAFNAAIVEVAMGRPDAVGRVHRQRVAEALELLVGWDGVMSVSGKPVPFSPKNARALFATETEIAPGQAGEGLALGDYLAQWLLERAAEAERFAMEVEDAAAKNSEVSAAGA